MSPEIEQHLARARQQISHQDTRGAIESLRRVLSVDADHAGAHALLALCLHDERRIHAAEHEAGLALALEPEAPIAHYAMAVTQQAMRRFTVAEEHFKQAMALDPGNEAYLLALARLYALWEKPALAVPLLEKARELAPDDPQCWAAIAEHHLSQREFDRADAAARRALELDPQNADALLAMGHLLLRSGAVADAREHALLVLRENPMHRGGILLLGAVKARQSPLLGLWWRVNSFFGTGSAARRVLVLVGLFFAYQASVMLAGDLGYASARVPMQLAWLGFCIYTWVGPTIFQKQLEREMEPARIDPKY